MNAIIAQSNQMIFILYVYTSRKIYINVLL